VALNTKNQIKSNQIIMSIVGTNYFPQVEKTGVPGENHQPAVSH